MSRQIEIDIDVADVSLTGFASNITGAGPWDMTTTDTADGHAHIVSIDNDSATNYAGQTFTLAGLDAYDEPITEAITGPAGSALVESIKYFKVVNTVTASGAGISTDTMDIGWVDEVALIVPLNHYTNVAATLAVDVSGTVNYTVRETFKNILGGATPVWADISAFAAGAIDVTASASLHATAILIQVNTYSSGAELQVSIVQSYPN